MLTFHRFKLEDHENCTSDFLQIHDGYNPTARRIGRYCGSSLPDGGTINTTHYVASLFFHADASVSRDGFALRWVSINPSQSAAATPCSTRLYYSAAVLVGRITGLACLSVRLSVPYWFLTRKRSVWINQNWCKCLQDRSNRCANFQFKKSKVRRGRPHNMSALGVYLLFFF